MSNAVGSVTSSAAILSVNTPVSLSAQPVSRTVNPGATVSFSVAAAGTAPLTYQWRKDGQNITGANADSLSIASASSASAGTYDVLVSNAAGSVTSNTATLEINRSSEIEFLIQPADIHLIRGSSATIRLRLTKAPAEAADAWQLFSVAQEGALLSGSISQDTPTSIPLYTILSSGEYFLRVLRTYANGSQESADTRRFHAEVYSGEQVAGTYEALLLSADRPSQDGAFYRGAVTLSVTRSGSVSGRIQYNEALPVAGTAAPVIRNYTPVARALAGRLVPVGGNPALLRLIPKAAPGTAVPREEVVLECDCSTTPPKLTARVADRVSGADGESFLTWESHADCRRVLPNFQQLSEAQKSIVGRHVVGGDFFQSKEGSLPAYLALQVTTSGRLLWSSRRPGYAGTGASTLMQEQDLAFSAKIYEGQAATMAAARVKLAQSWMGRIALTQAPNGNWSASVDSAELPQALELQSSCLSVSGRSITFTPGSGNWSTVREVAFAEGNRSAWDLKSGVSDILRMRPTLQFTLHSTQGGTEGAIPEQRWTAAISPVGTFKLLPHLNSADPPLLPRFHLDRGSAEFAGLYTQPGMSAKGRLHGFMVDSGANPTLRALGWLETGAPPFVTVRNWSLQLE